MVKYFKDILEQSILKYDDFEYKKSNNDYKLPTQKIITPMFIKKPTLFTSSNIIKIPDKITSHNNDWSYNGKSYNDKDMKNIMNPNITDKEGLEKAYSLPEKLYIHNNTLFVAGTSRINDVIDDVALPFHMTKYTQKYKETDNLLSQHPEVTNIVAHSLGSAVSLELQKNYPEKNYKTNTYGVPTVSTSNDQTGSNRYRNYGDFVSIADRGSNMNFKPSVITEFFKNIPLGLDQALLNAGLEAHKYDNFSTQQIDPNVDISVN